MEYYLEHSAKGTHWKKAKHKYIAIKNGRYVYPSKMGSNLRRSTVYEDMPNSKVNNTRTAAGLQKVANMERNEAYYKARPGLSPRARQNYKNSVKNARTADRRYQQAVENNIKRSGGFSGNSWRAKVKNKIRKGLKWIKNLLK